MTLELFTRRFGIHFAILLKTIADFREVQQKGLQRNES